MLRGAGREWRAGIRYLIALSLFALMIPFAGCVSVVHSEGSVGDAAAPARGVEGGSGVGDSVVWPARWGDGVAGLAKGVVVPLYGPLGAWSPRRHGPWHMRIPRANDTEMVGRLAEGRAGGGGYRFRMEGRGAFLFERDESVPVPASGALLDRGEPSAMFAFVSGRLDPESEAGEARVDIERTWFAYYDHRRGGRADPADPGIGTVMLLPGLFGVPVTVVDIVTATMRQRGWNVIRMLAPPARFVERTEIELDPDRPETASEAAGELMHRIAESAYACEAAWAHVAGLRPGIAERPKLVFGGSGGALALPAVVRRDPGRYDAAVIIAGGANILDVVTRSTYTEPVDALAFEWAGYGNGERPPRGEMDAFTELYLGRAPLDGYHAGAWMSGLPVLMLEASGDRAVPVENSRLLWERLGKPERWEVRGNHLALFLGLWLHTPRILDWVESRVLAGGESVEGAVGS